MKKNNKLIAEFMGAYFDDKGITRLRGRFHTFRVKTLNLKYHTSWDWLMPVINKCFDVAEDGQMSDIMHHLQVAEMDSTYDAVVEFINNYNNQNN